MRLASPLFRDPRWLLAPLALLAAAAWWSADDRVRQLVANTAYLDGAVTLLSLLIGAPLAFLLVRTDLAGRKWALALLLLMLFIPLYLQAAAWQAGFGAQGWFTMSHHGPALLDGWRGAIWVHTATAIPWVVLIVGLGLWYVEPELEEDALLDAGPWRVFRRVTLARSWAAVGAAALWVAMLTAGEMTVTNLFLVRTFAEELYTQLALEGGEESSAAWSIAPSVLITAALVTATLAVLSRWAPHDRHAAQRGPWIFRLGRWRWPASLAVGALASLLVGVPVGNLLVKAGIVVTRSATGFSRSWSLARCLSIVGQSPAGSAREIEFSLLTGAAAATAAVVLGLPLAWFARRGGARAWPAWGIVAVCLALPGPLIGLGVIRLMNWPVSSEWARSPIETFVAKWLVFLYDNSIAAPCAAQLVRGLPLATLVLWHALRTVPNELMEAAAVEGAGRWGQWRHVILPARWPAIVTAWLVALAVAVGDLAASILVIPPGKMTLASKIFGLIHYGADEQVAGICLSLAAGLFLVTAAAIGLTRTWEK